MSEPTPNKPKVTLENLLRLKRHERPPAEYWVRFDRELNERVWRALSEPRESWVSGLLSGFRRNAGWLSLGTVSALVLALTWYGNIQSPVKFASKAQPIQVASAAVVVKTLPDSAPDNSDNAQALAAIAENNLPMITQPALVAAKVLDSSNFAGFHKVPAMLAFATGNGGGVSYASDALANPALSARIRGSAY
jgi:hypothetical protein